MTGPTTREIFGPLESVVESVGRDFGVSDWFTIQQLATDVFATLVFDVDPVHNDPGSAAHSRWGGTIVQGAHLLSLTPSLLRSVSFPLGEEGSQTVKYYRLPRVRFISPLRVGDAARARVAVTDVDQRADELRVSVSLRIEGKEQTKPIVTAEVVLAYPSAGFVQSTSHVHERELEEYALPQWRIHRTKSPLGPMDDFHGYFQLLMNQIGQPLGRSRWYGIDDVAAACFACVTRAFEEPWSLVERVPNVEPSVSPFYQLSVVPGLTQDLSLPFATDDYQVLLNYGFDSVRWVSDAECGRKMRTHVWLQDLKPRGDGYLGSLFHAVEVEKLKTPAMCATNLLLWLPSSSVTRSDHVE